MKKNLVIALLSIALVICSYYLYICSNDSKTNKEIGDTSPSLTKPDFLKPMEIDTALNYIRYFRDTYKMDSTNGVYYEPAVIKYYIDSIYPKLIARMDPNPAGFSWKVGFYCMRRLTPSGRRLDYLVMPLRLNEATKEVVDFHVNSASYRLRADTMQTKNNLACQNCPGYDAGQLWP